MKDMKRTFENMDHVLFIVSIILFVFGLLNIVNASSQAVVIRYGTNLYNYFYKQLASILLGSIATIIILKLPTKKYYFWCPIAYIIVLVCLIYLSIFGEAYQGSVNWIKIKGFTFQPSEFAKPVMIIGVSLLFERFCFKLRNSKRYTKKQHFNLIGIIILVGILFSLIVFFQKDLGTMIILTMIFISLFLASPIQRQEKLETIIFVIVSLAIAVTIYVSMTGSLLTKTQLSRFDFRDPCEDYENGGYQICNGFIAINDGGLLGVGIGNSKQISYLPESHTDSVFAIIAEEYGFILCSIIFFLYIVVLYRVFRMASRANTIRGKYMCLGIGVYIGLHIVVNLGGLFGSMPLTGVPLPFLSYGGTFTLSLMGSLAIVQRVHIEKSTEKIVIK